MMINSKKRKRIVIAMILTLAMLASLVPASAVTAGAKGTAGIYRSQGKFRASKIKGKNALSVRTNCALRADQTVENDRLEEKKVLVREYVEEVYEEYVKDRSLYCSDVWAEIEKVYSSASAKVEGAKHGRDLFTTDGFFLYIADDIESDLERLASLSSQIKHYIKSSEDIKKLVKAKKKELKELKKQTKKKYFNNFYWGRLQNLFYHGVKDLNGVRSVSDYLRVSESIDSWMGDIYYAIDMSTPSEEQNEQGSEEDNIDTDEDILIAEPGESDSGYIIILFDDEMADYILTKKDVEKVRVLQTERLDVYIDKRLSEAKYKGDTKKLKKEVQLFKKKILDKLEDKEAIEKAGDQKLKQMMAKTGIGCPAVTLRDFVRAARIFNAKTSEYSRSDYSERKWNEVETCFYSAKYAIEEAQYQFEMSGILDNMDKKLKKITPVKAEFAKLLKKAKKKLHSYTGKKGRKKYDQKKVRKVVKKGLRALGKVEKYEVAELENVLTRYELKAEKCIRKFRITVNKAGKGKVTGTAKVKYGDSYKVKLTPKAGWKIVRVTVDGRSKKLRNTYAFRNVRKAHKISVVFGQ